MAMLVAAGLFFVLTSLLGIGAPTIFLIAGLLTVVVMFVTLYFLHQQTARALAKLLRGFRGLKVRRRR